MSNFAVRVENVSKAYTIGVKSGKKNNEANIFGSGIKLDYQQFYALKDINLEIKKGESLAILGKNGAGKSTFLKVLSRITAPSTGRIEIHGRMGSLLEVGTGFHPDLTGRENVFLNGSILGMSRSEIKSKFDQIVEFSGISKFIDLPVKRYSSGMYVRLAFSVAAHMEPDLLIVDEVLAVGDMEFQNKCRDKITDLLKDSGRTVILVSHTLATVSQFCKQAIMLEKGRLVAHGGVQEISSLYLKSMVKDSPKVELDVDKRKPVCFTEVSIYDGYGELTNDVDVRKSFKIKMRYVVHEAVPALEMWVRIKTFEDTQSVFTAVFSDNATAEMQNKAPGVYEAEIEIPAQTLMPGTYIAHFKAYNYPWPMYDEQVDILKVNVVDFGTSYSKYSEFYPMRDFGTVQVKPEWTDYQVS